MNQDKLKLIINNQEKIYDVYFSFTCPQTNKGYIVYSEHQKDADGNEIVLVSAFDPNESTTDLFPVTDTKEMELILEVYEKIKKIA